MTVAVARAALAALGLLVVFGTSAPKQLGAQVTVSSVTINSAGNDSTFAAGDQIAVTVNFGADIYNWDNTAVPLNLIIGSDTVVACSTASCAGGNAIGRSGLRFIEFLYRVQRNDLDADGISIPADAMSAATFIVDGSFNAINTALTAITNSAAHKVDGNQGYPRVTGVVISSDPGTDSIYVLGDTIEVKVAFDSTVAVVGTPQLALGIGTATRQAGYASGTGSDSLVFRYAVASADRDADGLSIGASALTLSAGDTIRLASGTRGAVLGLGTNAITNSAAHMVDGSYSPPAVSGVSIASPPIGSTFERGDTVVVTVTFNEAVDVTGAPRVALTIGSATKYATYASGTGTASLVFRYVVVTADTDADGLSIGATALALNGGTINEAGGTTAAVLGLGSHAISNSAGHIVAGGTFTAASVSDVSLTSSPAVGTTYGRDEVIEVEVEFNRRVAVTGTPQVALTVGAATRQAAYASGTGTRALVFRYAVAAADADTDGIAVGASALALNSGTIADARDGSTAASLGLGSHALAASAGHKVDGTLAGASVTGVAVSSTPESADTYGLGERIEVQVTFDRAVTVTGSPQLALTVGTVARQASYAGGSGTATLSFAYRVQGAGSGGSGTGGVDADADGVGVAAGALTLNGATIVNMADGVRPATLGLGSFAIAAAANDKVDGTVESSPVVMGVAVTSEAPRGIYGPGIAIRFEVVFSRPVEVVGAPSLALVVGSERRQAAYVSGSGTPALVFEYVVRPADRDADGISVPADALTAADGAVLRLAGGTAAAALDLGDHALPDLADHAVNGAGSLDPEFGDSEYVFELVENVAGPLVVGEIEAESPLGARVEYELSSGGEGLFEVDAARGALTYVGSGEDAELRSEFVMLVTATTEGGTTEERVSAAQVKVEVVGVNDEVPAFLEEAYAFELPEGVAGPVVLGLMAAEDPDEGDTLRYALAAGDADRFDLDARTGELRYVGDGEDYYGGGPRSWRLEATATDLEGRAARAKAEVALVDMNEAPAFADSAYAFELAENVAGPLVLGVVRATDPDRDDRLTYSLSEGDAERFEVDTVTGEVRYVGDGEDAETGSGSWELAISATDRSGVAVRARVTVALTDVNEAPSFGVERYEWEIEENVAGPLALGVVEAADPDRADTLTYSLSGEGAAAERFEVNAVTGEVRYVGSGEDAETGPERYEFEVVAVDGEGLEARAAATVAVLDVNEAPAFADSAYAFELAENAAGPLVLGAVEATDPDRDDVLAYSLAEGDAERFEVDSGTGAVRYVGSGEDYEAGPPTFALMLRATDSGGLTAEAGAEVTLLNVNEGPEAVGAMSPKMLEAYGAAVEEDLGQYFRDPDGDALSYAAESSPPEVAQVSVSGSGRLSIAPRAIGQATVTVRATDPGGLSAQQQVQVTVEASRSERSRALKLTLAAFGRSLGTETVDAIGGRLGLGSSGSLGRSHLQVGGRSLSCAAFGGASGAGGFAWAPTTGDADHGAGSADTTDDQPRAAESSQCGLGSLVRDASGLLGLQFAVPSSGFGPAPSPSLDLTALLFGNGQSFMPGSPGGQPGFGGAGSYQGQQQVDAERGETGGPTFNPIGARSLRSQSSFQLSFGGAKTDGGANADNGSATASSQAVSRPVWTLWGQANLGNFEGRPEDGFSMDGRTRSAYLGLDYRFASGFLVGLAGSRSDMAADFDSRINGTGTVDARLTSLYPYVHWSSAGGFGVWGLAGAGRGDATLAETAGGGKSFDTDLGMRMGALGVRQELTGALALKADAFAVRIVSDDVAGMAGVTANAQRVRLAPEVGGQWALGNGMAVRARVELGGRFDGGDAETGIGAEAGAQFGLTHQASGFSMAARGRVLLAHQEDDFKDWGAGFSLRLQPGGGESESGLSFSVEPSWGNASSGAQTLWQGADVWQSAGAGGFGSAALAGGASVANGGRLGAGPDEAFHADPSAHNALGWAPDRLAMEVGYGIALPGGNRVEPFGRWSRESVAGHRLNVGTRWALLGGENTGEQLPATTGLRLTMDLFGEHVDTGFQPPERRVGLLGRVTFD